MKKKRLAALLLAGALLVQPCGALAAEKEETGSDAAVRQTAGNDFAEGQANAIHAPSLAAYSSSDDCVQIGIEGTYYTETKETILNRINEIRYEACEEGVQNPRTGEPLTKADYVPIRWSSDLEEIARQRAAEASVVQEHTRPDGSLCFTCTSTGGESTWAENLAWNWSGMMRGIEQWYEEKEDWVAQDSSAVTGHYTALISPSYYYIGLGTFQQAGAGWYTVTAEFSWKTEMDESKSSQSGTCVQPMSVTRDLLSNAAIQGAAHMKENESGKLSLTAEIDNFSTGVILSGVTWTTSAPNIVSVSSDGTIEALSGGTATITATVNDELYAEANITVDHLWDSGSVTREPTETKEGIKTYCCTGCGATKTESIPKLVAVTGISLNKGTLSLVKGSTDMLTATITPSNAANKTVTWTTSNSKVATVSGGKVTAVAAGTATITAKSNNGKAATCKVTVVNPTVAVTGIKLDKTALTLNPKGTATLTATITPSNATNKTVTWTTSDSKVAAVSGGKVTAVAAGTATITAKSNNGKTATCKVTVVNPTVAVTGIKLNKTALTLNPKGTASLTATITPSNATNKTVTWTTSNSKVATVSGGKVTAVAAGTATITAKSNNGKTATCKVTVVNPTVAVTGIKLDKTALTLGPKGTATLTATITPSNATNKTVTWTTSNSKVATVSGGKVTAVAAGTATITAKSNNGKTATCKVTVVNPTVAVTGIKLDKTALTLNPKGTASLTATITPSNATNKTVTWTTSNSKVAAVSGGKVTAVAAGTATITAKSNNGKTATCKVTVVNPTVAVTGIKLNKTALTLNPKGTATLKATITPSNATNKTVTWTTSNSKVAIVSGGKVTAVAAGTATITAKSNNGKTATCKVTVVNPTVAVTGIKLNKTALTLNPKGTATLKATITPSNATNKTVTWTTSNSKVATVSNGKVTAVAAGTATITAKSNNGKTATCKVTVVNPTVAVTGIKLDKTALTLNPKGTASLTATITPSNATNKTVTWTTSNSKVATVSGGKVTAVAAGTATITAKSNNGKTATCKVTVVQPAKAPVTEVFSDVPANAWYVNAVQYVYDNGIMAGTGGEFLPNATMTRAMVVQTLYNLSGAPKVSGTSQFPDVKTTDWYFKAVLWAEQNKVAAGSDGLFLPNALVTREQFAQFLYNYAGTPKVSGELRGFADAASVSGWARNALTWATQNGIVSGKPSGGKLYLDPKGKATRAEAAAMLMKYHKIKS